MHQNKVSALKITSDMITVFISVLWFYAAVSKLIDFQHFRDAMQKQPFTPWFQITLIYGLPAVEVCTGLLLIIERRKLTGLYISAALFAAFIAYILLILSKFFGHIPCSCGGLIERMGWTFHLWFNVVFLVFTSISIITSTKEKGEW
jgi:putative oxidoreductase